MSHDINMHCLFLENTNCNAMLPTKNHNLRNIIYILGQINKKINKNSLKYLMQFFTQFCSQNHLYNIID